jgi:CheY-like chemotaxis protein
MRKPKILTVDDDRAITAIFKRIIERSGLYEVKQENFSDRALRTAREFMPDLILLDWSMPILNGSKIAAQLQEDPDLCKVPIVFVTGYCENACDLGFPCIQKPVAAPVLIDFIARRLPPDSDPDSHETAHAA